MTRIHFLLTQLVCSALALLLPAGAAWANWGENWGSMVWSAPPPVVPGLGALGLALLALGLAAAAAWQLRRRAFAMSVLLVVLAIPLAAVAGSVSGLNVFVNGQPADAGEVNENFDIIEAAVNDNDTRITTAQGAAEGAQATADAAQVRVADSCAAGSSIRAIAADGTVTCEADTDTNTQLTSGEVSAAATAQGFVTGAHTVDTTLDEAAVDAFVDNNGYAAASVQGPHDRPGDHNTALGNFALLNNTDGGANTAVGHLALWLNTTGDSNTASGTQALASNTEGKYNTASGYQALWFNITGSWNTAVGMRALRSNTEGDHNTATGVSALWLNTTGDSNTATGSDALNANTTGSSNTASGRQALYENTEGFDNTANGTQALFSNTLGDRNTASGKHALRSNTEGGYNTASGFQALHSNTTANNNTASGANALYFNTEGDSNTASGVSALLYNTTGEGNTAVGGDALYSNTTGDGNIALGHGSGYNLTTGDNNIMIGNQGVENEAGTIRLGTSGTHTVTHLVGDVQINGVSIDSSDIATNAAAIVNAQTTADDAATAASTAQTTAETAVTDAATAQSTANTAQSSASTAQSSADGAQGAADAAQATANAALADAAAAQSAADNGYANSIHNQTAVDQYASFRIAGSGFILGNTVLGDSSADTTSFNSRIGSDLDPAFTSTYDLGSPSLRWDEVFTDQVLANRVGIGVEDPAHPLHVVGNSLLDGSVDVVDDIAAGGDISAANYPKMVAAEAQTELYLGTSYSNVVSVSITTASAGSILVTFSGFLQSDAAGGYVQAGVGTATDSVSRFVVAQSTDLDEYHPFSVQYLYEISEAGTFTYHGNALSSVPGGDVYQPYITAVYTD